MSLKLRALRLAEFYTKLAKNDNGIKYYADENALNYDNSKKYPGFYSDLSRFKVNDPKLEIDWTKVPIDTPVIVSDDYNVEANAFFVVYCKNAFLKFNVFGSNEMQDTAYRIISWKYCYIDPAVVIKPEWYK